ncbi:MAG TPA: hypothetical protein PL033_10725 [Candidatus Brocadiia bacterium]|nr:hypothetical protein [Candidatus Brocadiia bacterium]
MPDAGETTGTVATVTEGRKSSPEGGWIILWAGAWIMAAALCYGPRWADHDLWGHLAFGRDYIRAGRVLTRDPYSYTARGRVWHGHEPLFEATFWLVYEHSGVIGLIAANMLMGLGAALFVWLSLRLVSGSPPVRIFVLLFSVLILSYYLQIRPQLYTYVCFAVFSWILFSSRATGGWKRLLLLPVIIIPWANAHGGFMAGLGLSFLYFIGGCFECFTAGSESRPAMLRRLAALAAAGLLSGAASLINPIGLDLWRTFFRALDNPYTRKYILDWMPIPFPPGKLAYLAYYIFSAIFLVFFAAQQAKRRSPTAIIIAVVGMLIPYHGARHVPLSVIMLAPFFADALADRLSSRTTSWKAMPRAAQRMMFSLLAILCGMCLFAVCMNSADLLPRLRLTDDIPVNACRFIREAGLKGNIFCEYGSGEYLIWQLGDRCKVGKDGRYDTVYPLDVIADNLKFFHDVPTDETLSIPEKYETDMILVGSRRKVAGLLAEKARPPLTRLTWVKLYGDETATLFVREGMLSAENIESLRATATRISGQEPEHFFPTLNSVPVETPLPPDIVNPPAGMSRPENHINTKTRRAAHKTYPSNLPGLPPPQ